MNFVVALGRNFWANQASLDGESSVEISSQQGFLESGYRYFSSISNLANPNCLISLMDPKLDRKVLPFPTDRS